MLRHRLFKQLFQTNQRHVQNDREVPAQAGIDDFSGIFQERIRGRLPEGPLAMSGQEVAGRCGTVSEAIAKAVRYSGWTTDGRLFDSSVKRGQPASLPAGLLVSDVELLGIKANTKPSLSADPFAALADSRRQAGAIPRQKFDAQAKSRDAANLDGAAAVVIILVPGFIFLRKLMKSQPLQAIPQAVRAASKMKDQMVFDCSDQDAELFAIAEEEMAPGNPDRSAWAQAPVKAEGNEAWHSLIIRSTRYAQHSDKVIQR